MSDLERIGAAIKMMEQKLIEAERYYHHALRFGSYDEQGTWVDVAPKGDYVKAYLYSTIQRMFEGVKK